MTNSTLQIQLQNQTSSSTVYAYITGTALNNNNALFLLQADGKTPYYPPNPSKTGTPINANTSISLGGPGSSVSATIPQLAGARIWFSVGAKLVFYVNPGPGLVEPSIFNPSDANHNTSFGFMELTFNSSQLFANISYVDFVCLPIAMTLKDSSGTIQHVSGMPSNGLQTIATGLTAQTQKDGYPWSSLVVKNGSGQLLRILSPNSGILLNPSWFQNYWTNYVNQVYSQYTSQKLTVNTQASFGNVAGQVSNNSLSFGPGGSFRKPSAADIFSNSSGPFATGGNAETNTLIPRLAAGFNRSIMLSSNTVPNGATPSQYYQNATTNHYARIVHVTNLDGGGYAFPYDDVTPDGGVPQEGAVFSSTPALLTVVCGGANAYK
ncbi:glycoside hydrolase family 64 protein [Baudoinia panamericana UAMH 10762]|uniref:Glycoside hydrolase family 64 protein n=1 Tax=Baudoinia panamericana (strain UAMH 10762) TaxID=717646 RepID=M2N6J3_BAUPA|nr:glycoside hydrolase family 64 protein [Baudoinia panamericana UAMH 10762]EMC99698.1 glycoside hydrolase family 64 protein [Baudoinia panamericana UAMH 10762]